MLFDMIKRMKDDIVNTQAEPSSDSGQEKHGETRFYYSVLDIRFEFGPSSFSARFESCVIAVASRRIGQRTFS